MDPGCLSPMAPSSLSFQNEVSRAGLTGFLCGYLEEIQRQFKRSKFFCSVSNRSVVKAVARFSCFSAVSASPRFEKWFCD